jgi:hypothetical protein
VARSRSRAARVKEVSSSRASSVIWLARRWNSLSVIASAATSRAAFTSRAEITPPSTSTATACSWFGLAVLAPTRSQTPFASPQRGAARLEQRNALSRGELERLSETRGGTGLVRAAHFDRLFVYVVRVAVSITAGATMRARTTERLDSMRDGRESDRFSSRVSGEAAGALGRRRGVVPGRACVPRAVRQPARGDGWRAIAPPRSASGPGRIRRGCRRLL